MPRKKTTPKHKPEEYVHLKVWCKSTGSMDYYVKQQQERASEANAPVDALYERYDGSGPTGEWACASDLPVAHYHHVQMKNYEAEQAK
jgi:hypothetical protein